MKKRKSTMVELVDELEKLRVQESSVYKRSALAAMIAEAKAGEYHDFKNQKYVCGKVAANEKLVLLGFASLARRVASGEFDEEADEQDKAALREGLSPQMQSMLGLK